ncbi:hypothetical protein Geu3261_0157_009 [Komagataeibacter europaeus NBRC 3261]|uniref:DUF2867 domain-containing protein n=1 Tax=Komagataeibacter europaeus NBRC 3261 TaxID=1234669 RepID=A0A0D6Q1U7_KOMEU|nr:hypothetical protein [Komagataeibacter europaeus]GAN97263.1 hypothetical protein Geu3261_0157_009 [Komagataeibacter europaeus NBRC 3261]
MGLERPFLHEGMMMALIDDLLPCFTFTERHALRIHATGATIMDCVSRYRAQDDPLIRLAISLREGPARMLGLSQRKTLDLDDFTPLGRVGDREMVMGLAGAFWRMDYGLVDIASVTDFLACRHRNVCRLVMGFTVGPAATGQSLLVTETRVSCPTPALRRRFAPYWHMIRPVSGLIRKRMLARIRQRAEAVEQDGAGRCR